ncbi:MAG: ABC transporter substrate-binding protein [Flavobacteriaceae bacterium]|nr:ABC transporter substrate-binding protein [Flavobacteriaceae bacterium]
MTTVNIGGVPEHFNLSWYLTLKDGSYKDRGINLRWQDYHGGTGQMCRALRNEEIDLAVVLTEGIIKDIIDGNQSKIVQVFVASPLIWGIHVAAQSEFQKIEQLNGTKAAISRFGSGSHLMAYVNAQRNNWDLDKDLKFELIKNLDGAVEGLTKGIADYFLWEKFTTKPLVDDGVFRRIGECPTPWPCFVIAASNKFIKEQNNHLQTILEIINTTSMEFKQIPSIDRMIANRYGQDIDDVKEWLSLTEWSSEQIDGATLDRVQKQLFDLGIIDRIAANDELIV